MIPLTRPYFSKDAAKNISNSVNDILLSGNLMMGEWTKSFEEGFSKKLKTSYSLTTNTCTTALQICLQYFDVKGLDVLVPSGSFQTNISTIKWAGGNPILVDMNPETLSFSLDDLKKKITPRTKGIVWVHVTGVISKEYRQIVEFAKSNKLFIIEDCAHAHGSSIDGIQAGTIGDVGCFSFYPSKVMTTGTGGMIVTKNPSLAEYAMSMRLLGRNMNGPGVKLEGNDWFMDEIRACIGYFQLLDLDKHIERRSEIAKMYNNAFIDKRGLSIIKIAESTVNSYYQYPIILNERINRDKIVSVLKEKYGISSKRIWLPTHEEEIFQDLKFDRTTLINTEKTFNSSLCLPIFYDLKNEEVEMVIKAILTEINI